MRPGICQRLGASPRRSRTAVGGKAIHTVLRTGAEKLNAPHRKHRRIVFARAGPRTIGSGDARHGAQGRPPAILVVRGPAEADRIRRCFGVGHQLLCASDEALC